MNPHSIELNLAEELGVIASRHGCELLAARYQGGALRLILDREAGITVTDCERVSREASAVLDVADFASGKYVLEVSSPGLDREFFSPDDYQRFLGQKVSVKWHQPDTAGKRTDIGTLAAYRAGESADIEVDCPGELLTIPLDCVIVTRLEPEF